MIRNSAIGFFALTLSLNSIAAPPKSRGARTTSSPAPSAPSTKTTSPQPFFSEVKEQDDILDSENPSAGGIAPTIERKLTVKKEKLVYLFGGFDLGFSTTSAFNEFTEGSRSGIHTGVRGLVAFYFEDWVLDAGLGWQFARNSGMNPDGSTSKVITRGSYLEFSPRYRIGENWQLGPVLDMWLTTDNGLNQDIRSSKENTAVMGGLQGIYEWDTADDVKSSWKYRLGARWLTDTNISGRTFHQGQVLFQIGFPVIGEDRERFIREEYVRKPYTEELRDQDLTQAPPVAAAEPKAVLEPVVENPPVVKEENWTVATGPKERFVITLELSKIPFDYDKATLPREYEDKLRETGHFLGEHSDKWQSLTVQGHTDERGKDDYNLQLSLARARTVKRLLIEGGSPADRIRAEGWGERRPVDRRRNEKAYAKNRRVEFIFRGVKDALIIRQGFQR